ncbi:hypothetical protein L0156_08765 [bacterium]|nr:hypothetical protein [bacterium]
MQKIDMISPISDTKILISKNGTGDSYFPGSGQTAPRQLDIRVRAMTGSTSPEANKPIYFRIHDPADPSLYRTDSAVGDNKGTGSIVSPVNTDSNGYATSTLTVTDQFSGDNYEVEASFDPSFPCSPNCSKTAKITAWKRAYIEHIKMWKKGEFIIKDSGNGSGNPATEVYVKTASTFRRNDVVVVFSGTYPVGETRQVVSRDTKKNTITLNLALNNLYPSTVIPGQCDPSKPATDPNAFTPYCAKSPYSFVARTADGAYDVAPSETAYVRAFDDTFAHWKIAANSRYVPAWPDIPKTQPGDVAQFIYDHTLPFITTGTIQNHVALVSAGTHDVTNVPLYAAENAGLNYIAVFEQRTRDLNTTSPVNAVASVTAHELGHMWDVNGAPPSNGEDDQPAWIALNLDPYCLMNQARDRNQGVQAFHTNLGSAPTIDLYCIRGHVDNLFQYTCTW